MYVLVRIILNEKPYVNEDFVFWGIEGIRNELFRIKKPGTFKVPGLRLQD
jgi:hypothetical protein